MNKKRWIVHEEQNPISQEQIDGLSEVKITDTLAKLLIQRGITTFDQAKSFFTADLSTVHDPFLMKDMDKAVERLHRAILEQECILVYGDYDVDGTTSVSMFYSFLKHFHDRVTYYIPDRNKEGYGVSTKGIEFAIENKYTLVVTLDCGIKSIDKVAQAKGSGVDFIICDHHRPDEELPDAYAILDPKRSDCNYPYKELTGCGVGFKLIQAYLTFTGHDSAAAFQYLDFVMISIAADIVPITGENRVLAKYGLQLLNEVIPRRPGLQALIEKAGMIPPLTITNVVFGLAPRINAAGRIEHAHKAVELMLETDIDEAANFANRINEYNTDRKQYDSTMTEEALRMIQEDEWLLQANSSVLYKEDWHKGVIGIVASRCIEHYFRPTIILTKSNGKAAGSARSVPGFDVYEALERCSTHLEQFGGHTFAAGMTLPIENIPAFRLAFEKEVSDYIQPEQLIPRVEADAVISFEEITSKFYRILQRMAPFGPGNMTPTFVSHQVRLKPMSTPRILKEKHLRLEVVQGNSSPFVALAFGMAHYLEDLEKHDEFSLCYTIEENEFRGNRSLQLYIKDIQFNL